MPRQHVELDNLSAVRERILVHAETVGIGEVMGELPVHLEDVAIVCITFDGYLSLQWCVRDVGCA